MLEEHKALVPAHVIGEIASAYGLEELRLDGEPPHEGLGYFTFRLASSAGDLALRRKKGSGLKIVTKHPDIGSRIERQHLLILFLHDHGFPVAAPLRTKHGRTYLSVLGVPYSLYQYVDGQQLNPGNTRQLSVAGENLARFHQLTARYPKTPPFFQDPIPKLFEDKLKEWHNNAEGLTDSLADLGVKEAMRTFNESVPDIVTGLRSLPYDTLPRTIIHGDYTPQNLLFRGDELRAVLDFGRTRREARVLDLAITIHGLMRTSDPRTIPEELRVFATGYGRVLALEDQERKALPLLSEMVVALKGFKRARRMAKKKDQVRRLKSARKFGLFVRRLQWLRDNSSVVSTLFQESSGP